MALLLIFEAPPRDAASSDAAQFAKGGISMSEHNFVTDHWAAFQIIALIALIAAVIFCLALPTSLQVGLLIAAALFLIVMLGSRERGEPPCGGAIGHE